VLLKAQFQSIIIGRIIIQTLNIFQGSFEKGKSLMKQEKILSLLPQMQKVKSLIHHICFNQEYVFSFSKRIDGLRLSGSVKTSVA